MMRVAAALVLWVVVLGGLDLYMARFDRSPSVTTSASRQLRTGATYSMELTTTFGVEPDPFALNTDASREPATLIVRLGSYEILRETQRVEAGAPFLVSPIQGMTPGLNEFFVEANMSLESSGRSFALRLRLMRDGLPVAEKTFWSEGQNKITGTFQVDIEEDKQDGESHHEH